MQVYIEDIILDNLIIDFIILLITAKLSKIKYKWYFLLFSSIFGVVFTTINLYINLQGTILFFYKILMSVAMVAIAFNIKSIKKFLLNYFTFLLTTFLMGGGCFLICFSFGTVVVQNANISYDLALPVGVIVGIFAILSYLILNIFKAIKEKTKLSNFEFDVQICNNNLQIKTKAFVDTGNTLVDPISNKPITIIDYHFFKKFFKQIPIHEIILKKTPKELKNPHYISVGSVGKKTNMLIFEMEKFKIFQKNNNFSIKNAVFGLTFVNLEKNLDCPLLLNPDIINGDKNELFS